MIKASATTLITKNDNNQRRIPVTTLTGQPLMTTLIITSLPTMCNGPADTYSKALSGKPHSWTAATPGAANETLRLLNSRDTKSPMQASLSCSPNQQPYKLVPQVMLQRLPVSNQDPCCPGFWTKKFSAASQTLSASHNHRQLSRRPALPSRSV